MPRHGNGVCVAINRIDGKLHNYNCYINQYPLCEDTTTTELQCGLGFTKTAEGCFYVDNENSKNWTDAEETCKSFCGGSHLVTLDTQEVSTSMLYCQNHPCGSMVVFHLIHN